MPSPAIVGSPDTVVGRIAAPRDEFGFGNLTLVTGFLGNLPQEHVVTTLALCAQEVMPRVQPAPAPVERRSCCTGTPRTLPRSHLRAQEQTV
jgi:hypothetical protein